MTQEVLLTPEDVRQLAAQGIDAAEAHRQLDLLLQPPAPAQLDRACTPGDGVLQLDAEDLDTLAGTWDAAAAAGRACKFVPASGAASRMFRRLLPYLEANADLDTDAPEAGEELERRAAEGEQAAADLLAFCSRLRDFAFWDALSPELQRRLEADLARGAYRQVVSQLLGSQGLDYAVLPKGLLPFHRYRDGCRSALGEHLVEAVHTLADREGRCRLHFTVPARFEARFREHLDAVAARLHEERGVHFDIGLSVQAPSTDTLALSQEDRLPFRETDGRLLLRPSGHGALLSNLTALEADLVLIKNIDNVLPDARKATTLRWKRVLGGYLVQLQARIFELLEELHTRNSEAEIDAARELCREHFGLPIDAWPESRAARREFAILQLDRPLRVCGVVKNEGQPGGGPFWVRAPETGAVTPQIVETAQVDLKNPKQRQILTESTHFNPVDLACGVRDWRGAAFDLQRFVDPRAVFLSIKSHQGRELRALERPGLWNGAMAHWNTVFVEVPAETFAPVKTVFDLLKAEHRQD